MDKKIVILGAGISGLATAHWLCKEHLDFTILEKNPEAGGAMISRKESGYMVDYGPNSGLETTPLIKQIVDDIGLSDQMIYAGKQGNKRYILRNNTLHPLPLNPISFFKTKLFSGRGKLRIMAEPFIGKSKDGYYQSMAQFVKRRLGQEFLDYAINPFVAGVFAGNPEELSVKSAFPKLYRLEEVYGGLIKGMIKGAKERKQRAEQSKQSARMFSFINGMQTFPKTLAEKLKDRILYDAEITQITKKDNRYIVTYNQNGKTSEIAADIIVSTLPAYAAAKLFNNLDNTLAEEHLLKIYYPPVQVLYLGYEKQDISQPLDGFGFLIPQKEKKSFLGAIWSSVIFQERTDENHAAFTLFVGGARSPELFKLDPEELKKNILKEFHEIMKITGQPVFMAEKMWNKAIPQYNVGYIEHERYFEKFEMENKGIILSGNYRGGISVGDCIKNSEITAGKVKELIS